MESVEPYINQHNKEKFYLWLKHVKKFSENKVQIILSYITIIDTYINKNFTNISSIYFVNNSDELERIKKSLISSEEYRTISMATALFLLEVLNYYSNYMAKNASELQSKLQSKQRIVDTEQKINNLSTELISERFKPLIYALQDEGIYTVEQFYERFRNESLIRYLNKHELYSWKERIRIIELISELVGEDRKTSTSNSTTKDIDQKQETSSCIEQYYTVNFDDSQSYAHTKPKELIICEKRIIVRSWTELLVALCDHLMKKSKEITRSLLKEPLFPFSSRPYFSATDKNLKQPKPLENGTWVETNLNADRIVELCKLLCKRFDVKLDEVIIRYYSCREYNGKRDKGSKMNCEDSNNGIIAQTEEFIKSRGLSACSLDEVITAIKQPSRMKTTMMYVIESSPRIIEIAREKYIHRDNIVDLDEAAECLLNILQMHFRQFDGYTNCRLLFDAVRIELPLFINDNALEDEVKIYAITKHLFSKECFGGYRFVFYNNIHIWEKEPDYPKSIRGLLMHRARLNGGIITRLESEMFLEKIKMRLGNFQQAIQSENDSTFYQYAPGEYVLSEALSIDKDWLECVKKALDRLFTDNEYIIPRDIIPTWYEQLPELPIGVTWTPLLLQEVLAYNPEIGYKAVFAPLEQKKETVAAAIIRKNSELSFADVVSDYLYRTIELPQRMRAEDLRLLLKKAGMIEGNELIYNMHKALDDYRFAWSDNDKTVYINKG